MSLPQAKFREIVFQMLYSYDMSLASDEDMLPLLMAELAVTKKSVRSAQERVHAIISKQTEMDALIKQTSTSYEFERIPSVERNILRLGTFELLFDPEIPPKVAIAEAMRLARKFGTPESASFINAILDNIRKASLGELIDTVQLSAAASDLKNSEKIANEAQSSMPMQPDGTNDVDPPLSTK